MDSQGVSAPSVTPPPREGVRVSNPSVAGRADAKAPAHPIVSPSLLEICRAMGSGLALNVVLNTILRLTVQEMCAQEGSILLFDEHQDRLQMLASFGLPEAIVKKGYIPRKDSIAGWVIESGEPLLLNDEPKTGKFTSLGGRRRIVSSLCFPLKARGGIIGTININRTDESLAAFGQADCDAMDVLAAQAASCIENARLHEACLRSERLAAIGQTVAGVSHCIKNVMTGLQGGVSLVRMARDKQNWDMLNQSLEILGHSATRVQSLVMDMLEYSKERQPELTDVDLTELCSEIVEVTVSQAKARGAQVFVSLGRDAAKVTADGNQLYRCLLNLVQNALDVSPEGGTVSLSSERTEAESAIRRLGAPATAAIVIRVADQGDGISEEVYPKLFEPFFSTKGSKGTGLGLAVTRKIIAEHGGKLELASAPGEPAVFAIYLRA